MSDARRELRCVCSRKPLLGIVGKDKDGVFLHVKFPKGGEIVVRGGSARVLCRECLRWIEVHVRTTNG